METWVLSTWQCLRGTWRRGKWDWLWYPCSFETSVTMYQSVQHNSAEYLNLHQHSRKGLKSCNILTLSVLMSYIYGAPSKARNFNVVYISTYVWQRWKLSFCICCTIFQHCTLQIGFFRQLCVNTLPATKVALISHECISVMSLKSVLCSSSFGKADNPLFLSDCTMSEHGTYHKSIFVVRT